MKQKATSDSRPKTIAPRTYGLVHPVRGVAVRLDAVRDAGQQHRQADTEGQDARPVESARRADAEFPQRPDAPDGAENADRHTDPEDRLPVPLGEEPADEQTEEGARDGGHHVDAERHAALVRRKRVGQDRRRRRHQHRAADALHDPPADQPQRATAEVERIEGQRDGSDGEDDEAEVVDAHPAEHVAESAERDDENRRDDQVAHQHPQQVTHVARRQWIEADAAEDGGKRDEHDRGVDGGQQRAQRGVGQHHPLVEGVVVVHPPAPARGFGDGHVGIGHDRGFRHLNLSSHQLRLRIDSEHKTHILAIQTIRQQFVFHAIALDRPEHPRGSAHRAR